MRVFDVQASSSSLGYRCVKFSFMRVFDVQASSSSLGYRCVKFSFCPRNWHQVYGAIFWRLLGMGVYVIGIKRIQILLEGFIHDVESTKGMTSLTRHIR